MGRRFFPIVVLSCSLNALIQKTLLKIIILQTKYYFNGKKYEVGLVKIESYHPSLSPFTIRLITRRSSVTRKKSYAHSKFSTRTAACAHVRILGATVRTYAFARETTGPKILVT